LAFDAKGGESIDSGGVLIEGFVFLVCYFHASCLISRPALCDYELVRLYFISCHLIGFSSCLISRPALCDYELVRLYFISCHLIGFSS
jgi:hypothetical protein